MLLPVLLVVWGHVFHMPLLPCPNPKRVGSCSWCGVFSAASVVLVVARQVWSSCICLDFSNNNEPLYRNELIPMQGQGGHAVVWSW